VPGNVFVEVPGHADPDVVVSRGMTGPGCCRCPGGPAGCPAT